MDWMQRLKDQFGDKIKEDKKFSEVTTLEIGGPIKAFIETNSQDELVEILKFVKKEQIPFLIIGGGSNLLVSDEGVDFLVIKNNVTGISHSVRNDKVRLVIQAGTVLQDLVDYTIKNGLGGMNHMTGVPGTVGGAIYGSAGAYGDNIRDYLFEVKYFDPEKDQIITIPREKYETGYRDSLFKHNKNLVILEAVFANLPKSGPEVLKAEGEEVLKLRVIKYPPDTMCPGSFFKNVIADKLPKDILENVKQYNTRFNKIPAGALIEAVGGKGDRLRQIKIADNHGNTFINLGQGTAEDFYKLAKKYHQKVKEEFGISLEPEVQLINLPEFS